MSRSVGRALSHESAVGHVTGAAKYVDDLFGNLARVAHAWPVAAQHVHARVVAIDGAAALACAGVLGLLTAADVPGENDTGPARHDEPLFPDQVCFHGQPIAWVLAETEEQARAAAGEVGVVYEPLPAILSIEAAIAADSFLTEPEHMKRGEPARALAAAPHRLSGSLFMNGQEHFYLETQAALAWVDESDHLFVQSSTQHPSEMQEIVARVLGVRRHEVVVQCLRMGGGFGGKETQANAWAAVAALGARKLRRPVRVRLTRAQDMTMTGKRHPFLARFDVGFDSDGQAARAGTAALQRRRLDPRPERAGLVARDVPPRQLLLPARRRVRRPRLPDQPRLAHRVSRLRRAAGHGRHRGDPRPRRAHRWACRRRSCASATSTRPATPHALRPGGARRQSHRPHLERAARQQPTSTGAGARSTRCNARSAHAKRGLAMTPVKFGISFTTAFFNQAGALVLIYQDGTVQVNHGGTEMGQGLHTKMLQVAADALGLPLDAVRMMPTRTDKVPNTSATAASSGSDLNGAAVRARVRDVARAPGRGRRAPLRLRAGGGRVRPAAACCAGGGAQADARVRRDRRTPPISSACRCRRPATTARPTSTTTARAARGKPFHYFAYGAAVSEVEVDGFTGQYRVLRVDILHDVGDSLSPLVDRGQIEGGFIQGVGWLTSEELVWTRDGALATNGASTYKIPTLGECPPIFHVALLGKAAEPGVVHGSKAVGEPPLMLAISVREALRDAVAAFGRGGVVELALPGDARSGLLGDRARAQRRRLVQRRCVVTGPHSYPIASAPSTFGRRAGINRARPNGSTK